MAKIWSNITQKSFLHKVGSKDFVSDLHKLLLFHLMGEIPFDLPHTVYINILRNMKTLRRMDDIHYVALINKSSENTRYSMFLRDSIRTPNSPSSAREPSLPDSYTSLLSTWRQWKLTLEEICPSLILIKMIFNKGGRRSWPERLMKIKLWRLLDSLKRIKDSLESSRAKSRLGSKPNKK